MQRLRSAYGAAYFKLIDDSSRRSAEVVVPLVTKLVNPRSVVDVGCGTGAWLSVFLEKGIDDVLGIDGDHIPPELLRIPAACFLARDLEEELNLGRQFDLAVSLEVAEHLSPQAAEQFIDSVVSLAPVILFSAAVPGQGGHHHVNEQWPDYWADLFAIHGYEAIDCIREQIWDHHDVDWWYAQNTLLYVDPAHALRDARLALELGARGGRPRRLLHPGPADALTLSHEAAEMIESHLTADDVCVLIDDGGLPAAASLVCRSVPFTEHDGHYWGPPTDSDHAVQELARLREAGATHLVVTWACFWWREFYGAFFQHLEANSRLIAATDAAIVYELAPG